MSASLDGGGQTRPPGREQATVEPGGLLVIGPISSLYDLLTFLVLLHVFHAGEGLFHTGWFVESLATQTLVLFVIRTPRSVLASRPSWPLVVTTLAIVATGVALPDSPLAGVLGFEPLPAGYFLFLTATTVTYLALVELAKRRLFGLPPAPAAVRPGQEARAT